MALLELHGERRKKFLSSLLYARTKNVQRELQRRPEVPLYRRGPRVYKVGEPGYRLDRREASWLSQAGWSSRATAFYGASEDSWVP